MAPPIGLNYQNCGNCIYWQPTSGGEGGCHYNAPIGTTSGTGQPTWQWPLTAATDWCGQWKQEPPVDRTV